MLDDLEPEIRAALVKILAAIYETGMRDDIELSAVLRLLGVVLVADEAEDGDETIVMMSFQDEGWIQEYMAFKDQQDGTFDEDLINPDRVLH